MTKTIKIGDSFKHELYGNIEVISMYTTSEEIEIIKTSDSYDVVNTIIDDKVEFIDDEGKTQMQSLDYFIKHIQ